MWNMHKNTDLHYNQKTASLLGQAGAGPGWAFFLPKPQATSHHSVHRGLPLDVALACGLACHLGEKIIAEKKSHRERRGEGGREIWRTGNPYRR